ncbi:MAG: hypothetical protein KAJ09_07495 [Deltaproteobacteria bacterium]|nr:hypothetical protein [Deltaproteobacteria bacterium]
MKQKNEYHSYLVRLWQDDLVEEDVKKQLWQGEVIHIQSGQSWRVQDLEALMEMLRDLTTQDEP